MFLLASWLLEKLERKLVLRGGSGAVFTRVLGSYLFISFGSCLGVIDSVLVDFVSYLFEKMSLREYQINYLLDALNSLTRFSKKSLSGASVPLSTVTTFS